MRKRPSFLRVFCLSLVGKCQEALFELDDYETWSSTSRPLWYQWIDRYRVAAMRTTIRAAWERRRKEL